MAFPDPLYRKGCGEVGGFGIGVRCPPVRQGRKPGELEKTLFNKGLF